jgi:hypothetical protein
VVDEYQVGRRPILLGRFARREKAVSTCSMKSIPMSTSLFAFFFSTRLRLFDLRKAALSPANSIEHVWPCEQNADIHAVRLCNNISVRKVLN